MPEYGVRVANCVALALRSVLGTGSHLVNLDTLVAYAFAQQASKVHAGWTHHACAHANVA
ncbi:uncharacterized protein METZ01_LOCUS138330 [marine metagenome]|uniref:Uncharacterized protein n=1 Tax=marine metagenome TaxID=408172 RepID=A0A381Z857_9ZZZZ